MSDKANHRYEDNPFTPMAVASRNESYMVTVETDAFHQARDSVQSYLASAAVDTPGAGNVLAVIGEYGTGKTHLLTWLMRQVQQSPRQVRTIDIDAPDSFASLFRRFVSHLGLSEVSARVSEIYADIVAENLQSSEATTSLAQWLRTGSIEPRDVVQRLGMTESVLLKQVQERVTELTGDRCLSTALILLLRRGFDEAVWEWLMGAPPSQVLYERGITTQIDSDVSALAMLGSCTRLLGGQGRPFVLVLDEVDKVLTASRQSDAAAMAELQALLTHFAEAHAFLVMAGLPDVLTVLRPAIRARIGRIVTMSPLSPEQVVDFVRRTQEHQFGEPRLRPFTEDVVALLRDLAQGTPRMVIRLCYRLYRAATVRGPDALVTEQMVRDAVREQYPAHHVDARFAVSEVIERNQWPFFRDHFLTGKANSKADFWLRFGEDAGGGCAVLVTGSVLELADVEQITQRAVRIQSSGPNREVIVVVDGVIADRWAEPLREQLPNGPLTYNRRDFTMEFTAMVGALRQRLQGTAETDPVELVRVRFDQVNRQQSAIIELVSDLADKVDTNRAGTDQRIAELQRAITGLPAVFQRSVVAEPDLPTELSTPFARSLELLDLLLSMGGQFQIMFPVREPRDESGAVSASAAIRDRLVQRDLQRANGITVMLRQSIVAFRRSITEWFTNSVGVPGDGQLTDAADLWLNQSCLAYERVIEVLPLRNVEPLIAAAPAAGSVTRSVRFEELRSTLEDLGARVKEAAVRVAMRAGQE